ncbi:stalk domain-containing protein [Anoxynatronum buryatiense]|uniref:Repeat domain (List_Bact_rpt) n=1 Tax=Anoxynatronum buryatiense TaxID=489973 RepID=A0AA45WV19_9CLOT|nr:stalk domain-containing protein [Anoxynatronum buryatiense]SMP51429.1 repeat domain (List_Bact_rpt) [Anoxynatronum buryatiense]
MHENKQPQCQIFRCLLGVLLVITLTVSSVGATTVAFTMGEAGYTVDGIWQASDAVPYIQQGRTMVPVRFVAEALGADVHWDANARRVTVDKGSDQIVLEIGSRNLMKNDELFMVMDTETVIVPPGRTMIPVSRLAAALDIPYQWDAAGGRALFMPGASVNQPALEAVKVFDTPGVYGPETGIEAIEGNVVVASTGVTLQNYEITGELVIDERVGDGTVTLNQLRVWGSTHIHGGGAESIHINGGQYWQVYVKTGNGEAVRIVAVDAHGLEIILAEDAAGQELILEGSFDLLMVEAAGVIITTAGDTSISDIVVTASAAEGSLTLSPQTRVEKLMVNNDTLTMTATGNIGTVEGTGKEAVEQQRNQTTAPTTAAPAVGGGGGGGGTGQVETIAVSGVQVSPNTLSLVAGGVSGTLTATVAPANASNKGVLWSTSDAGVATVANGVVTPVAPGSAAITATASGDGTKKAVCNVTVAPAPTVGMTVDAATVPIFPVGDTREFELSMVGNDDTGKATYAMFTMPLGSMLEFKHSSGDWIQILQRFPASGSFPVANDTTLFRASFQQAGNHDIEVTFYDAQSTEVMASTTIPAEVRPGYQVFYDGNGNTAGTPPVDQGKYYEGETVRLRWNAVTEPERMKKVDGGVTYSFSGWNRAADGSGEAWLTGPAYHYMTMGNSDVTLYAVWKSFRSPRYYGTEPGQSRLESFVEVGTAFTLFDGDGWTKAGFTLKEWNTQSDGSGTPYQLGETITMPAGAGEFILRAIWEPE